MKRFIVLLTSLILSLVCCLSVGCSCNNDDVKYIQEKGNLVVGITVYPPMDYIDEETGEWTGFDAELANMFGKQLGVNVQFVIIKWSNKVAELNSKNIDVIWNGMTISNELDENIDFSCSYAENKQVAVVKASDIANYSSVSAIKNAKIAVEQGSAGDTQATETVQATTITRVKDQVTALTEVKSGQSDVALIDLTMAQSIVGEGQYSDLAIVDTNLVSFGHEEFAVGVRTDSNLKEELNKFFKTVYNDGTMQRLADKYGSIALNNAKLGAL